MPKALKYGVQCSDERITLARKVLDVRFGCGTDGWCVDPDCQLIAQQAVAPLLNHLTLPDVGRVFKNNRKWEQTSTARERRKNDVTLVSSEDASSVPISTRTEWLPLSALQLASYQRKTISTKNINKMVRNWSWVRAHCLLIGERKDGTLWIVDGGHRYRAAQKLGFDQLKCEVFASSGFPEESLIFHDINSDRIAMNARDLFWSLYDSEGAPGVPPAVQERIESAHLLYAAVSEAGFQIARENGGAWPNINCIGGLMLHFEQFGLEAVVRALQAIRNSYGGSRFQAEALRDYLLLPLIRLAGMRPMLNDERLCKILAKDKPDGFRIGAREISKLTGYSRHKVIANEILKRYNNRCRKKLEPIMAPVEED